MKRVIISIIFLIFCATYTFSQNRIDDINKKYIKGTVLDQNSRLPLSGVNVYSSNLLYSTSTDVKGKFFLRLSNETKDSVTVYFDILGYRKYKLEVRVNTEDLVIYLKEDNLTLSEVVVTATNESKLGSENKINTTAIEHLQATNLGDVMQLLPGHLQENPSLNDPSQVILRQAIKLSGNNTVSYGEKEAMNALGLKTIVDGMPLSNNSNLQIYNIANTYSLSAGNQFNTVVGRGTDMRQISTENIENITVISGIPSARYGDLTSGVVLIETKAGRTPVDIEVKTDPRLFQVGFNKGFKIKRQGGFINAHLDYTKSLKSENEAEFAYKRVTANLIYSKNFFENKNFITKTNVSFSSTFDDFHSGVMNMSKEEKMKSSDVSLSVSTRGKLFIDSKWLKKIEYQLGYNRQWQKSDVTRYRSEPMQTIPTAYHDTMMAVDIVPYTYLYNLKIEGIPTRYYFKLNTESSFDIWGSVHHILLGGEWTTEKNSGRGKIFDINNPPGHFTANSLRPRRYKDIPALNSLSIYLEDEIKVNVLSRDILANLGVRYDNYDPTHNSNIKKHSFFSPRINIAIDIIKNLKLKGGLGRTAKSIPMVYLYPERAYFDFLNLNYYKSFSDGHKEYFFLNTTRVFDTENKDLKIATANKKEIGLSYKYKKIFSIDVTLYDEKVYDSYTLTREPVLLQRDNYKLTKYIDKYNSEYEYLNTDTLSRSYTYPSNDRKIENRGVEFQINVSQIDLIKTSFLLNGSYVQTKYEYTNPYIINSSWNAKVFPVFKPGDGTLSDMFLTTLTAVHHIPTLRYVVSLSMQTIWSENNYSYYAKDSKYPIYLIDNGIKRYDLTDKEKEDYSRDVETLMVREDMPPLFLFNLRLTKEIGDRFKVMVSINNLFFSNPIYKSKRYKNTFYTRNSNVYYGFKLMYKI